MKISRIVLILALLAMTARGDDWSHLGRDDGRSRLPTESIANPAPLAALTTGIESIASPVAADGFLVLAGLDGSVRAYRESDRALLWTVATGSPLFATPLLDQGRVIILGDDGTLRFLRLADGVSLGSVTVGGSTHASPLLVAGRIFTGSAFPNPALAAVDSATKSVAWMSSLDQVSHSSPAVGAGKVVLPTNNGTVAASDAATGSPVWSTAVGGSPGGSTAMIVGTSVFVFIDGGVYRLDLDTGAVNGSVVLSDAAPADTLSVDWGCSSLTRAGGLLVGCARADYALDHNADGYVDAWTMHELAFAIDPVSMALLWQAPLGSAVDGDLNSIPPYRILPSPVALGTTIAFASSLDSDLRFLDAAGNVAGILTLDAPSQASLMLANARVYALTRAGTLYVMEDPSHPQPASVGGLTPSGAHLTAAPATLSWSPGPAGSTYTVRLAQDDEILMDWDLEQTVGTTSIPCPVLAAEHRYTWAVRVRDASGACAPWSITQFAVGTPPQPATGLVAVPKHARVVLSWMRSPSPDVVSYQVASGPTSGALGAPVDVGNVDTTSVEGLIIGTNYTFEVRAVDSLGFVSSPATATATPVSTVTLGGVTYATIADALAAASSGDTVHLDADVYTITATLHVPAGVGLQGVNALDTGIRATSAIVMIDASTGAVIDGLWLAGGSIGVSAAGSAIFVTHCVIRDMSDAGVDAAGIANVINNTIVNNTNAGIRAAGRVHARNNIVQGNGVGLTGIVISKYNDVSDGYAGPAVGEGDKSSPVSFRDSASGDFREQDGQPSLDAGAPGDAYSLEPAPNGYRINMGAFGNTPLAALSPASSGGGGGGSCGLLGLEAVLALLFLSRRRR